jgi:hypothetical protein
VPACLPPFSLPVNRMKNRLVEAVLFALVLSVITSCDDDKTTCCMDPTWIYEWRVENHTADSLEVFLQFSGSSLVHHAALGVWDTQILVRQGCFLCGPPSASLVGCVAAYTMDGILRYEQTPGDPERWVRRDIETYENQMTLTVKSEDLLSYPVADQCGLRDATRVEVTSLRPE